MDFDSPDVEKDFPGLYAEGSSKKKDETNEGDHEKLSKKDLLIGRRKDKKDLKYATLDGESSPEEDLETKSPSKSKKSKPFKFTATKSKEKRDKIQDKDKIDKILKENVEIKDKDKKKVKKEKEKKDKDKDKKEKKNKTVDICEEVLEIGDVQPVFGVSVSLATERSCCHDKIDLPLVIRDCIDYLQENGLQNDQIYRFEPVKNRLLKFKRIYNNRDTQSALNELDVPTACGLLKLFLKELPEPILTTDLVLKFEKAAGNGNKTEDELDDLLKKLPSCNKTLLGWIFLHFQSVIQNEKLNKLNAQNLAIILSPPLQMSQRLLLTLLDHCSNLFTNLKLIKYVPPITASSPKLPENPLDIQTELLKQESLLSHIHVEMNAGFASKKREEQLWEVQRIITQLKRKLRSFEKRPEKHIEDSVDGDLTANEFYDCSNKKIIKSKKSLSDSDDDATKIDQPISKNKIKTTFVTKNEIFSNDLSPKDQSNQEIYIHESGRLMLPESHPDYLLLLRLQFENQELLQWKQQLQLKINNERAEILDIKKKLSTLEHQPIVNNKTIYLDENVDYEKIIENYLRENNLLKCKRNMLATEIFEEKKKIIQFQIDLSLQSLQVK